MTVLSAGDLNVEIDFGIGSTKGVVQRLEKSEWRNFEINGKQLTAPVSIKSLPPGRYRVIPNKPA
jgi:hypothetical protein